MFCDTPQLAAWSFIVGYGILFDLHSTKNAKKVADYLDIKANAPFSKDVQSWLCGWNYVLSKWKSSETLDLVALEHWVDRDVLRGTQESEERRVHRIS